MEAILMYVFLTFTTILIILEMVSGRKLYICFATSCLVATVLAMLEVDMLITLGAFGGVTILLLFLFAKVYGKNYSKNNVRLNADAAIGKRYTLITPVEFNKPGSIKVNDVIWGVTTEFQGEILDAGSIVQVLAQRGNLYIVKKVKRA
jgi:membrane protein implicated in regulation of membrane protease activity